MRYLTRHSFKVSLLIAISTTNLSSEASDKVACRSSEFEATAAFIKAYGEFDRRLKIGVHDDTNLERHLADIDNYKSTVYQEGSSILVSFIPLPYQGSTLRGGGGRFIFEAGSDGKMVFEPYR